MNEPVVDLSIGLIAPAETAKLSAAEKRFTKRLLALHPGLGKTAETMAALLSDSGLGTAASAMVLSAVYSSGDLQGRGQSTRSMWFVEAIRNRYGHRLEMIKNDPKAFESFIYDMGVVTEMRDQLKGEDYSVSFHAAFLLWELGESSDSVIQIAESMESPYKGSAIKIIVRAAQLVKSGEFSMLETAVRELRHGYEN